MERKTILNPNRIFMPATLTLVNSYTFVWDFIDSMGSTPDSSFKPMKTMVVFARKILYMAIYLSQTRKRPSTRISTKLKLTVSCSLFLLVPLAHPLNSVCLSFFHSLSPPIRWKNKCRFCAQLSGKKKGNTFLMIIVLCPKRSSVISTCGRLIHLYKA